MRRRIYSFCLSLLLVAAARAEIAHGTCGAHAYWTLSEDRTLTVTGTGAMDDFTGIPEWFAVYPKIYRVVVEEGITSVGDCAFRNAPYLQEVELASSVKRIGKQAFFNIPRLRQLVLPEGVCSVDDEAFSFSALQRLDLPKSMTDFSVSALNFCQALQEVTVQEGNAVYASCEGGLYTESLRTVLRCPQTCTDVVLPAQTDSIAAQAFFYCDSLRTIDISSPLHYIGDGAFAECASLTRIDYTDGGTEIPAEAFSVCDKLESMTIPSTVTTIQNAAFFLCINLRAITLPQNLRQIAEKVFMYCGKLRTINSLAETPPAISSNTFEGVDKSKCRVYVPEGASASYRKADYWKDFLYVEESDFSSIEGIVETPKELMKDIYNLSGQRIQRVGDGIYIINGKKVRIKAH